MSPEPDAPRLSTPAAGLAPGRTTFMPMEDDTQ